MSKVRTILYAEDDLVVLTVYQKRLQQEGYHVIAAHDGLEAMKKLSMFVPDLILLDLMLPKFTGEEVLQFIRGNSVLNKVPVIVLSTNSVRDMAQEHLLSDTSRRLIKSQCTAATLLKTIQEVLGDAPTEQTTPPDRTVSNPFAGILQTAAAA